VYKLYEGISGRISEQEFDRITNQCFVNGSKDSLDVSDFLPIGSLLIQHHINLMTLKSPVNSGMTLSSVQLAPNKPKEKENLSSQFTPEQLIQLKSIFEMVDSDGSDGIDEDELRAAMRQFGRHCTVEETRTLMKTLDEDGSTYHSKIYSFSFFDFFIFS
jgi:hypothetical protein